MDRFDRHGIRRRDTDAPATRHVLVSKRHGVFALLHRVYSRWRFTVGGERLAEISARKVARNLLQMRTHLTEDRSIGGIVDADFDDAARVVQREVMRDLVLVEPHGDGAALLQLGILLHLGEVFLVRHSRRHRRMLRERRERCAREDDREADKETKMCWHAPHAKAWSRLQCQEPLTISYG